MKKIYLSVFVATICNLAMSQRFFVPTDYRGAFAPAPTSQWTDSWTNWDCQNTNYGTSNVNVTTNITNNTTWTANNTYLLKGQIYVKNGATLTIEPGTIVMGDKGTVGSGLFITQGSKLNANGTVNQPIVFTSNQPAGQRAAGDWGGIILLGRATSNQPGGIANIEGIAVSADTQFGGGSTPDDNDNSGSLKYVRIEFGGYVYQQDKEINGLTFGAVGRGTTIEHVQVSFGNDDAFEWFGGTVDCRYLVSYRNLDDDFDTDNGYSGRVQFGLVVRDPNIADNPTISTSEAFESDNNSAGDASTPQTSAIFSNITVVGPLRGNSSATIASGFRRGARIRKNSALKIYNSVFMDFPRGLYINGSACEANATNGLLKFENNINAGFISNYSVEKDAGSSFNIKSWYGSNNNDSVVSTSGILVTPYDYLAPDYRPVANTSLALSNYSFSDGSIDPLVIYAPVLPASTVEYCVGETATALSATALSACTLKWYNSSTGTSTISQPTPSTLNAGTTYFYVSQASSNGIEGPRAMITVIVHSNPVVPVISALGSTSLCTGSSVDLISNQTSGNVWSTNATSQTITVSTSGTYSLTYTDANTCSSVSNEITVEVSNAPKPTVQASGTLNLCSGNTVTLTASAADSYLWSPGGETTQSITVSTADSYSVTTTNADPCDGVGQSNVYTVTVTPQPVASGTFTIIDNTVTFTNTSTSASSYNWDFGDFNFSSASNPVHVFVDDNPYTVILTATNGICQDTATFVFDYLSVKTIVEDKAANISIYPNPMTEMGVISVDIKELTPVVIVVTDSKGSIVSEIVNQELEVGNHTFEMNAINLENGMYYVIVRTSKSNNITKINVVK